MATVYPMDVDCIDIVDWLSSRREAQHNTVLFLGARAGALFRGTTLYDCCQLFSARVLQGLTQHKQYAQCNQLLRQENFTQGDVDNIIALSLQARATCDGDTALAQLVKSGLFDIIISTNIDNSVEQAFVNAGMKSPYDFQIFNPMQDLVEWGTQLNAQPFCTLVKTFGTFPVDSRAAETRESKVGVYCALDKRESTVETHTELLNYLKRHLADDVLVIGYDPWWDRALGHVFPLHGGELWYVNETPCEDAALCQALQLRNGRVCIGASGEYSLFLKSLDWYMQRRHPVARSPLLDSVLLLDIPSATSASDMSPTPPLQPTQSRSMDNAMANDPKQISVFYSQQDESHIKMFMAHLKVLERQNQFTTWVDSRIPVGEDWMKAYEQAVQTTQVAVLFISTAFLSSDFLANDLLLPLLNAAEKRGARVIPFIVNSCLFEHSPLNRYKAFNDPDKPLTSLRRGADRERVLRDLALSACYIE
jgi:hypothetical protein